MLIRHEFREDERVMHRKDFATGTVTHAYRPESGAEAIVGTVLWDDMSSEAGVEFAELLPLTHKDGGSYADFRPILDRVLVRFDEKPKTTAGGLHIPDNAGKPWENDRLGTVMAVGPGRFNEKGERVPMQVKVGDRVLCHPNAHTVMPIVVGGVLMFVLDECDRPGTEGTVDIGEVFAVVEEG